MFTMFTAWIMLLRWNRRLPSCRISGPEQMLSHLTGPTPSGCKGAKIMSEQSTSAPSDGQSQVDYRDIPGFPGYRVGDDGSIWSAWRKGGRGPSYSWQKRKQQL